MLCRWYYKVGCCDLRPRNYLKEVKNTWTYQARLSVRRFVATKLMTINGGGGGVTRIGVTCARDFGPYCSFTKFDSQRCRIWNWWISRFLKLFQIL